MGAVFSFFIGTAFYGILTVGKFVAVEPIIPVATLEFIISIVGTIGMSCLVLNELKLTKFRWLK
jgi:hypothetical protein